MWKKFCTFDIQLGQIGLDATWDKVAKPADAGKLVGRDLHATDVDPIESEKTRLVWHSCMDRKPHSPADELCGSDQVAPGVAYDFVLADHFMQIDNPARGFT
ncbi:MAG: hypothetical protein ACLS43_00955 [Evtepia gabavorous]